MDHKIARVTCTDMRGKVKNLFEGGLRNTAACENQLQRFASFNSATEILISDVMIDHSGVKNDLK